MLHEIEFPNTKYKPVSLPAGAKLSEELTIINSPVLFGCRTGICGTCLVQIEKSYESLRAPEESELEALEVYAPGNRKARLACQIQLTCDIALTKIESV
jgi:ferredoxin